MITAKEARERSRCKDCLDQIEISINEAIEKGERKAKIKFGVLEERNFSECSIDWPEEHVDPMGDFLIEKLTSLGYSVEITYEKINYVDKFYAPFVMWNYYDRFIEVKW